MNSHTLNLSSYDTQGNYTLSKLYFEDHTKLTLNLENIPETYIPLYMKLDWGFGEPQLYDNDLVLPKYNKLNFLQYSSLLNTEYEFEYYPSETSLYKELSAQVFIKYSNGDELKFLIPIQVRTYGFLESLGDVSLVNTNILISEYNTSEHQLKASVGDYLFELRDTKKKMYKDTGSVSELLEMYASRGERVPAGLYYTNETITLNDNDKLILTEGVEIRVAHDGVGVSIEGNDAGIVGGTISGLRDLVFCDEGNGSWVCDFDEWIPRDLYVDGIRRELSKWPHEDYMAQPGGPHAWLYANSSNLSSGPLWKNAGYLDFQWLGNDAEDLKGEKTSKITSESEYENIYLDTAPHAVLNFSDVDKMGFGTFAYDEQERRIVYRPRPGETLNNTRISIPWATRLVHVKGLSGSRIENVVLNGVSCMYQRRDWTNTNSMSSLHDHGYGHEFYGHSILKAEWVDGMSIKRCVFSHASAQGLLFADGCKNIYVQNSSVSDVNSQGVCVASTTEESFDASLDNTPQNITLESCIISNLAQHPHVGAPAIFLRTVKDFTFRNSLVEDVGGCGIVNYNFPSLFDNPNHPSHEYGGMTVNGNEFLDCSLWVENGSPVTLYGPYSDEEMSLVEDNLITSGREIIQGRQFYCTGICLNGGASGRVIKENVVYSSKGPGLQMNGGGRSWNIDNKYHGTRSYWQWEGGSTVWTDRNYSPLHRTLTKDPVDNGDGTATMQVAVDGRTYYNFLGSLTATDVSNNGDSTGSLTVRLSSYNEIASPYYRHHVVIQTGTSKGEVFSSTSVGLSSQIQRWIVDISDKENEFDAISTGDEFKVVMSPYSHPDGFSLYVVDGDGAGKWFSVVDWDFSETTDQRSYVEPEFPDENTMKFKVLLGGNDYDSDDVDGIKSGDKVTWVWNHTEGTKFLSTPEMESEIEIWRMMHPRPTIIENYPESLNIDMAEDVIYYNINVCKSFKTTLTGVLVPLEGELCSEVLLINKSEDDVLVYDNNNFSDDNSLLLGIGDSIIMRGITNSNQISANGTGDIYYRTQYYSNLPAR